jgi:hypothetical protein
MRWHVLGVTFLLGCLAIDGGRALGQQPGDIRSAKNWVPQREAEFRQYRFQLELTRPRALTMEAASLLNWTNPERGTGDGAVFLWTDGGQPQMIACAFEWAGSVKHEFHSLSTESIAAERGSQAVHTFGPGIEWKPLPDAPPPSARRGTRLTQMRRQAERFAAEVGHTEWSPTRLLPQPVYRSPDSTADDYGVFVFVQGTDPECVLLLRASGEKEWHFALARQTKFGLRVKLDGKPIWDRRPNHQPLRDPKTPFLVVSQDP